MLFISVLCMISSLANSATIPKLSELLLNVNFIGDKLVIREMNENEILNENNNQFPDISNTFTLTTTNFKIIQPVTFITEKPLINIMIPSETVKFTPKSSNQDPFPDSIIIIPDCQENNQGDDDKKYDEIKEDDDDEIQTEDPFEGAANDDNLLNKIQEGRIVDQLSAVDNTYDENTELIDEKEYIFLNSDSNGTDDDIIDPKIRNKRSGNVIEEENQSTPSSRQKYVLSDASLTDNLIFNNINY